MIVIGAIIARHSHETLRNLAHIATEPDIPKNLIALMEEMRKLSKDCYASIYPHISSFKKEARLPLLSSVLLYHAIETAIQKNGYNSLTKRCYTSKAEQVGLLLKAKLMAKNWVEDR